MGVRVFNRGLVQRRYPVLDLRPIAPSQNKQLRLQVPQLFEHKRVAPCAFVRRPLLKVASLPLQPPLQLLPCAPPLLPQQGEPTKHPRPPLTAPLPLPTHGKQRPFVPQLRPLTLRQPKRLPPIAHLPLKFALQPLTDNLRVLKQLHLKRLVLQTRHPLRLLGMPRPLPPPQQLFVYSPPPPQLLLM